MSNFRRGVLHLPVEIYLLPILPIFYTMMLNCDGESGKRKFIDQPLSAG